MPNNQFSLKEMIQSFAPGWYAAVMGTGVIAIALTPFRPVLTPAASLQVFFLALAVIAFVILLIPWTARWVLFPSAALQDLAHPVSAAFFPTMPISILILGIALEKTSLPFLPETTLWPVLLGLWLTGSAGILAFALIIIRNFFQQPEVRPETATLGWLIPAVSALLVPVLGFSLASHYAGTAWGGLILVLSLAFTGAGSLLFLLVMALVFSRYIFHAPPPAHLEPPLAIGMAPTSLLTIILIRLTKPAQAVFGFSPQTAESLSVISLISAVALWGFAFFWLLLSLLVLLGQRRSTALPFALSWWAFVFPTGAFSVASGVLYQALEYPLFLWVGLAALTGLILLWLIITGRTLAGIANGSLLRSHAAPPVHPAQQR